MAREELVHSNQIFGDNVSRRILDSDRITPKDVDELKAALRGANTAATKIIANRLLKSCAQNAWPVVDKAAEMEPQPQDRLLETAATDHFVAHMPANVHFAVDDVCQRVASYLDNVKGAEWARMQKFLEADSRPSTSSHALKAMLREPTSSGLACVARLRLAIEVLDVVWSSETVADGPAGAIQRLQKLISLRPETDRAPVDAESAFVGAIVAFKHAEPDSYRIDCYRLARTITNMTVRDQWLQSLDFARSPVESSASSITAFTAKSVLSTTKSA